MKLIKLLSVIACSVALIAGTAFAAEGAAKDKTCCEKAAAKGKDCTHKCCVAAHKDGKSCEKCNPDKQDLKLKKKDKAASSEKAQ